MSQLFCSFFTLFSLCLNVLIAINTFMIIFWYLMPHIISHDYWEDEIKYVLRKCCWFQLSQSIDGQQEWTSRISSVQSLSRVRLFATPWTAARQASLSITSSRSLLKLMSIESVMPSNHLILCHPLLLPSSIFPSIWVFSMSQFFTLKGCRWTIRCGILGLRRRWIQSGVRDEAGSLRAFV